jgi:hypothetical protein
MTSQEILREVREEPWLAFYLEDADEDLEDARVRFAVAQRIAVRELVHEGTPVAMRFTRNQMLTTSYAPDEVLP